jgi:hypothetical protein
MKSISKRRRNGSKEIKGLTDRRDRETETKRTREEKHEIEKRTFMTNQ